MQERRSDHVKRKRVAEMSPEEMRRELLVSDKTDLPNRRAFEESDPSPYLAMCDVDGLKELNDRYGYGAGDTLIKRVAEILLQFGLEAYHDKGDEFLVKGNSFAELNRKLQQAEKEMKTPFTVRTMSGHAIPVEGSRFSFGIGANLRQAEVSLKHQKELRKIDR